MQLQVSRSFHALRLFVCLGGEHAPPRGNKSSKPLARGNPLTTYPVLFPASGTEEAKGFDGRAGPQGNPQENQEEATYDFSLDPDTKAAEKKLRRVVAKQVGGLESALGQTGVPLC